MLTAVKRVLKARAAGVFGRNRMRLWGAVRQAVASPDSVLCLRRVLPSGVEVTERSVSACLDELRNAEFISKSVETHRAVIGKGWTQKLSGTPLAAIIFCFVAARLAKPEVVVEAGCATGWTSTLLLFALHLNARGHLYSVDIPPTAGRGTMDWTLPRGLSPGFLVPEVLRERWTLTVGDVWDHLMPLLRQARRIDISSTIRTTPILT